MSAFAAQQSIAFRANVSAKTVSSSKRQSKKIVRSLRVEAAKKSVGDLSKGDLEGARSFFYKGWGGKRCARICVSFHRCSFAFYRGVFLFARKFAFYIVIFSFNFLFSGCSRYKRARGGKGKKRSYPEFQKSDRSSLQSPSNRTRAKTRGIESSPFGFSSMWVVFARDDA